MNKRTELKAFRIKQHLTQNQIAIMLNVSRSTYIAIESGARRGSERFWNKLQKTFEISDYETFKLQKRDK